MTRNLQSYDGFMTNASAARVAAHLHHDQGCTNGAIRRIDHERARRLARRFCEEAHDRPGVADHYLVDQESVARRREQWIRFARKNRMAGRDWPVILMSLRQQGATIIDSIVVVRAVDGCSLGEAKDLVHTSDAWADMRPYHDRLHAEFEAALESFDLCDGQATDPRG